jgi:hypothetical protein
MQHHEKGGCLLLYTAAIAAAEVVDVVMILILDMDFGILMCDSFLLYYILTDNLGFKRCFGRFSQELFRGASSVVGTLSLFLRIPSGDVVWGCGTFAASAALPASPGATATTAHASYFEAIAPGAWMYLSFLYMLSRNTALWSHAPMLRLGDDVRGRWQWRA